MADACVCIEPDYCFKSLIAIDAQTSTEPRQCIECDRVIPPGAPFRCEACYDPHMRRPVVLVYRTCQLCASVRDDRFECGWFFGNVWEDLRDAVCSDWMDEDDPDYDPDCSWLDPPTDPIVGPEP